MKQIVVVLGVCFLFALAVSARPARASVKSPGTMAITATSANHAVMLKDKDDIDAPKDKDKKSKTNPNDGKDGDPNDGNAGKGNDNKDKDKGNGK